MTRVLITPVVEIFDHPVVVPCGTSNDDLGGVIDRSCGIEQETISPSDGWRISVFVTEENRLSLTLFSPLYKGPTEHLLWSTVYGFHRSSGLSIRPLLFSKSQ